MLSEKVVCTTVSPHSYIVSTHTSQCSVMAAALRFPTDHAHIVWIKFYILHGEKKNKPVNIKVYVLK